MAAWCQTAWRLVRSVARATSWKPLAAGLVAVAVLAVGVLLVQRGDQAPPLSLSLDQDSIITELVSVLQHDNALVQYGYIDNRVDGRGYVAGRDAFSTATGGVAHVVARYTANVADNPLARYLPMLNTLASTRGDDVRELEGLAPAWQRQAGDAQFRQAQDDEDRSCCFDPAMRRSRELGLRTPLGFAILYDTAIQQGAGPGVDTMESLITTATEAAQGTPASKVDEHTWLAAFLAARDGVLRKPSDDRLQETWSASAGRVSALRELLVARNDGLSWPLRVNPYGTEHVLFPVYPVPSGAQSVVGGPGEPALLPTPSGTPPAIPSGSPGSAGVAVPAGTTVSVSGASELRTALVAARPGQTIMMADGDYAGVFEIYASGTANQPITLKGSARAILQSTGAGLLVEASYWHLVGFTIIDSNSGVVLERSSHVLIDSVTIHDLPGEGIKIKDNSTDNLVRNAHVYQVGNHAVTIGRVGSDWPNGVPDRSDRNTVTGGHFGPGSDSVLVQVDEGSTATVLTGNSFDGSGTTRRAPWVLIRGNGVNVTGNVGVSSPADGFQTRTNVGGWGCDIVFHNNRADVRSDGYGFLVDSQPGCPVTVYADNVVSAAGSGVSNVPVTR